MLNKVIVQTSTPVEFNITDVDPDEILILKSISGLTQAGATLYTGEFVDEGGYYQGRRAKERFPVLNFKVNPDFKNDVDASDIRNLLYRMFMEPQATSDQVQVALFDSKMPELYFQGYTEDIDATLFDKELSATVSMKCTDPYLRSAVETFRTSGGGWLTVPITYDGSADTGFEVEILVQSSTSQLVLENNGVQMILARPFLAGDSVSINTNRGERHIRHNSVDVMAALQGPNWLKLNQASNVLRVFGTSPGDAKAVALSCRYRSAWWGI